MSKPLAAALYEVLNNYMVSLECQEETQRQGVYTAAEAAKATFECLESVIKAVNNNYKGGC